MAFKEITASFEVVGEKYHYRFEIKRRESGAFKYGDRSCHTLDIYDFESGKYITDYFYDTRYEHIETDKESWLKVWIAFVKREWVKVKSVNLIDYSEIEVGDK